VEVSDTCSLLDHVNTRTGDNVETTDMEIVWEDFILDSSGHK